MLDRITCIKSFVRTVELGNFSAVARELGTTQPTISKQIAALEEYLDVQLLTRSPRQVAVTDEGDRFYQHCQNILELFSEAESSVGKRQQPSGILRVNCAVAFGQMQVVPRLKRFLDAYPEIKIDLTMSDRFVDLVEEGLDVVIRIGHFSDRNFIAQPMGVTRLVTVGAASYLKRWGEPKVPTDLTQHNCIVYTQQATRNEWQFRDTVIRVGGNLQVNNSMALREAVLAGLGIGTSRSVRVILKEYEPDPLPIQAIYRRGRFQSAKVKCFVDFLIHEFEQGVL
jgi:DNA-binding transcriptional LysR family regulator